jgi:hypothetical protein
MLIEDFLSSLVNSLNQMGSPMTVDNDDVLRGRGSLVWEWNLGIGLVFTGISYPKSTLR